jgi:hypothetical protein
VLNNKSLQRALFLGCFGTSLAVDSVAQAAPNDAKAKQLAEKALYDDYLNLRFDDAARRLKEAISLCEGGCSKSVTAQMYRDLGVVLVAGKQNRDDGVQAFAQALSHDPAIELDDELNSPEVAAAFEEARKLASAPTPTEETASAPSAPQASGAIAHDAPTEQVVNTPLPLFVGVNTGEEVARVTAFIRGFGMPKFKALELAKLTNGFGGETSCADVGTTTGEFQYYIVAYDQDGKGVGRVGNETEPVVVLIKSEIDGPAPRLPDRPAPKPCAEPAATDDCPPDFPGCGLGDWGDEKTAGEASNVKVKPKQHWLSLSFQGDFMLMPADENVCSSGSDAGYECFYGGGSYRNPAWGEPGAVQADGSLANAGKVGGGLVPATMRVLLGYDYAATEWLRLGVRVGFAFNGGPQVATTDPVLDASGNVQVDPTTGLPAQVQVSENAFLPFHAEGRVGFWLLSSDSPVRPHFALSGGLAQVDAKIITPIVEPRKNNPVDCPPGSDNRCLEANLEAWRTSGTVFGAGGLGLMIPFAPNHGVDIEGKFMLLFPGSEQVVAAQLGYLVGL